MADFNKAFDATMGNEGGYANNPHDSGGETYKGIARNFWRNWTGWRIIDQAKAAMVNPPEYGTGSYYNWVKALNRTLADSPVLQKYVRDFYQANFWKYDDIKSQEAAEWIFDHHVNAGARGVKWAQEAAGVQTDGEIGPKSIAAINALAPSDFLQRAKMIAGDYRMAKVQEDPSQRQFLHSWLSRDGFTDAEIKEMTA